MPGFGDGPFGDRYLSEFEFRYNRRAGLGWTDAQRANAILHKRPVSHREPP